MQKRSALVLPFVNRLKTTSALDLGHSCLEAAAVFVTIRDRMPKTKSVPQPFDSDRELYSGLIRLHVLHHVAEEPIFGLGMLEELSRDG
jgi:hypothetical protein